MNIGEESDPIEVPEPVMPGQALPVPEEVPVFEPAAEPLEPAVPVEIDLTPASPGPDWVWPE